MEWKDELIASFYEKHREPKDSIVKFKEYCKSHISCFDVFKLCM